MTCSRPVRCGTAIWSRRRGHARMALILIVDDSPTEVHVIRKVLEKHGYKTAAAGDGAEGIRLAAFWNSGQDCTAGSRVITKSA